MQIMYFTSPQEHRFIFITNRKLRFFSKSKVYTDSFMLYAFLHLWSSTLQLLLLICSSGEEILNITSSQQRLNNNYQQMAGSRGLRDRKKLPFQKNPKQIIGDNLGQNQI